MYAQREVIAKPSTGIIRIALVAAVLGFCMAKYTPACADDVIVRPLVGALPAPPIYTGTHDFVHDGRGMVVLDDIGGRDGEGQTSSQPGKSAPTGGNDGGGSDGGSNGGGKSCGGESGHGGHSGHGHSGHGKGGHGNNGGAPGNGHGTSGTGNGGSNGVGNGHGGHGK